VELAPMPTMWWASGAHVSRQRHERHKRRHVRSGCGRYLRSLASTGPPSAPTRRSPDLHVSRGIGLGKLVELAHDPVREGLLDRAQKGLSWIISPETLGRGRRPRKRARIRPVRPPLWRK
jgi:hypothetical protein